MGKTLLIFGPPGVGKGTQAQRLAADLGIVGLATGDLFRSEMAAGSALGANARTYIAQGQLVPDDIVLAMVEARIGRPDAQGGFLLDGFPRTVPQAEALAGMLARIGRQVDAVIALEAPEDELVVRIAGRRTCPGCHASFHLTARPPRQPGVCDQCGTALVQRADDNESAVRTRLREYTEKTAPVLAFCRSRGWPVHAVPGVGGIDEVYQRVRGSLG